jgi:general stress protein 26
MIDHAHIARIRKELKEVGMTFYGFMKLETDHLPELIHSDEHIKGVVYGRLEGKLDSIMLVATDKRILFVDYKPFFKNSDEITYEVVAGIKMTTIGPFAGVVLHTRVQEYALRFVNIHCANVFVDYIENHIVAGVKRAKPNNEDDKTTKFQPYKIPQREHKKTTDNTVLDTDTAVLSTVGDNNTPHASVIHYVTDKNDNFYFITKSETNKARNIARNNNVAITIHYTGSLKSLLIKGQAELINDKHIFEEVYGHITAPKEYTEGKRMPPITKMQNGSYLVFRVSPTTHSMQDFSTSSW